MSKLHSFSERVAAATFDVPKENLNEANLGFDFTSILAFIEVIGQVVTLLTQNCPNQVSLKASIKNPTWLQRVRFRASVKEHLDVSGFFKLRAAAGKAADNCFKEAAKLTDEELNALLQETQNDPDNWLL